MLEAHLRTRRVYRSLPSTAPLKANQLLYRWDLDKTYLRTDFDTVRGLVRAALESASDKHTVPGAAALMREVRATGPHGVFVLSGSPEQLRGVLETKLRMDGVRWDQLVLKPQLRNILRGRFRAVRDQLSYKLAALLESRLTWPADIDEFLFGDDAETRRLHLLALRGSLRRSS